MSPIQSGRKSSPTFHSPSSIFPPCHSIYALRPYIKKKKPKIQHFNLPLTHTHIMNYSIRKSVVHILCHKVYRYFGLHRLLRTKGHFVKVMSLAITILCVWKQSVSRQRCIQTFSMTRLQKPQADLSCHLYHPLPVLIASHFSFCYLKFLMSIEIKLSCFSFVSLMH